ncbi:uncharacterized protein CTHT_0014190 [Thermochaetoides thermophila DSM 1495]|uniref:Phosphoribosylaminoimidazole-succinocarboxamide synthase n=1 Tax=Chaetomium thermophilum (strain DSM 1495 / CBS 144.50 / IMI 039719) TaxID=759272 RepID=G0S1N0_CHATD|nr:hypothetical protein CTHT_0014190 [Thermochaetoides thermophila DSM 1495]EGS22940.1 hypothetical protein CTHT_0014190 [Thermochaetoides thermophila DSM 1495]
MSAVNSRDRNNNGTLDSHWQHGQHPADPRLVESNLSRQSHEQTDRATSISELLPPPPPSPTPLPLPSPTPPLVSTPSDATPIPSPAAAEPDLPFNRPTGLSFGRPIVIEGPYRRVSDIPPLSANYQPDWVTATPPRDFNMNQDFREELARLDGVITPGIDNTPYIQYAIEALTRGPNTLRDSNSHPPSSSSSSSNPASHYPGAQQPAPAIQHRQPTSEPLPSHPPTSHPPDQPATSPQGQALRPSDDHVHNSGASAQSLAESLLKNGSRPVLPHEWKFVEREDLLNHAHQYQLQASGIPPPLTFRPWPLRTPALLAFMTLCVLMIAALVFSAVYSHKNRGLVTWVAIHGGRYFVFRFLPQLLAGVILLYSQFLVTTMFRILPFVRLASENRDQRDGALFQELYPTTFLWPCLVGPWNVWVAVIVTWLMNFTVPLQSSLFTVILVDDVWTWATVQGVAWTLVALYLALLVSTVIVWRYWASVKQTGLVWDPRSLADIAALVSETNTADDYRGTQLARSREGIRFALRRRASDRLGYWSWKDGRPGVWYTLGNPLDDGNLFPVLNPSGGQRMERQSSEKHTAGASQAAEGLLSGTSKQHHDHDHEDLEAARPIGTQARTRYLPWCLRTNQLLWFTITAFVLVLAVFIVSFLPATRIADGFLPLLRADPKPGAFSAADFLYSFLPALLGMLAFLLFQPLDMHLRILQPWATLSSSANDASNPTSGGGAPASATLLAGYPACLPFETPLRALLNGHWRLAFISFLSPLFLLIPVLAGGSFMALTTRQGQVRMFPNMPGYSLLLAMCVLYVLGLAALFPGRDAMRMPHGVTCLGEIVGYLVGGMDSEHKEEKLMQQPGREDEESPAEFFRGVSSKTELLHRLGVVEGKAGEETRWVFAFGVGGDQLAIWRIKSV